MDSVVDFSQKRLSRCFEKPHQKTSSVNQTPENALESAFFESQNLTKPTKRFCHFHTKIPLQHGKSYGAFLPLI